MSEPQQFEQKIGKRMTAIAWLLLLGLLTLLFSNLLDQQQNPNARLNTAVSPDGSREVVLKMNRAGHYVATGMINDEPVVFLLDTGATDVAIPGSLARRLGLQKGPAVLSQTANGTVRSYRTRLDSVSLGAIELNNVSASILPKMPDDGVLLGMSFLRQLDMIQSNNTLTLRMK